MLLQQYNSDFILFMIKYVEAHESRSHWTLMKDREFKNTHKNKYGKLKTILSIWYFKCKILLDGRLMKKNTDYVHMEECDNGKLNTGKIMLQW